MSNSNAIVNDPYTFAKKVIFAKWKPFLLNAIYVDGVTRFSRFAKMLPISEKVLSQNLKELEADGLIYRTVVPDTPPRVEYRLTELGQSVCPLLRQVYDWGWHEMKRRGMDIDPTGEYWHGYSEQLSVNN